MTTSFFKNLFKIALVSILTPKNCSESRWAKQEDTRVLLFGRMQEHLKKIFSLKKSRLNVINLGAIKMCRNEAG
jgi:hypothetical protein